MPRSSDASPEYASSASDSDPVRRITAPSAAPATQSSNVVLPIPATPRNRIVTPEPRSRLCSTPPSRSSSVRRPSTAIAPCPSPIRSLWSADLVGLQRVFAAGLKCGPDRLWSAAEWSLATDVVDDDRRRGGRHGDVGRPGRGSQRGDVCVERRLALPTLEQHDSARLERIRSEGVFETTCLARATPASGRVDWRGIARGRWAPSRMCLQR